MGTLTAFENVNLLAIPKASGDHQGGSQEKEHFRLGDFCIDEYKPLKVVVIGAGFSGVIAGIRYVCHCAQSCCRRYRHLEICEQIPTKVAKH